MNTNGTSKAWTGLVVTGLLAMAPLARAMEISSGDAEPLPDGATAVLAYVQHAERKSLFADGRQVPGNNRLTSDAGLLRVVHARHLSNGIVVEPQFILPVARLEAGGDLSAMGTTRGVGDLILAAPVKFRLDTALGDVVSFVPALSLPTGRYRAGDALNAGENRWGAILQLAHVHRFSQDWLLDSAADVTLSADTDDHGPQKVRFGQEPRYEFQAYVGRLFGPATRLSFGLGHVVGGETSIDGVPQGDGLRTTYGRLALSRFLTPTLQLQAKVGRDLHVAQGFKEHGRVEIRLAVLL